MFFLVQANITSDPDYPRLFAALEALQLPYETIHIDKETQKLKPITQRKDIFVIGSVKLARLAKEQTDWQPGSFYGGGHLFEVYSKYYQGHLLNEKATVFALDEAIEWEENEEKFIKPYRDAKLFTGKLFREVAWKDFVHYQLADPKFPRFTKGRLVQASMPQTIIKEVRLWVVGGQVVGTAYYKFHGDVQFERDLPAEGREFAQAMIKKFQPAEAFVLDICLTVHGWKVVEVNCINRAGFYPNLNIKTLLRALDLYFTNA